MAKQHWRAAGMPAACGLWAAACLAAFPALGGGRHCVVDGWGTGEGLLPQSSIISMVQTRDGYLWLGTLNGLARFDGVHFTVFDESTTPTLSSIQIVKLFEDSRSNLWIGTESAGAMLVTNGRIYHLNFAQGGHTGHLVSVCEDSLGAVWLLTRDHQLARYWGGSVDVWNVSGDGQAVIAEKGGPLWLGTSQELIAIDPGAVRSREALPERMRAPLEELDWLLASRAGGYWLIANGLIEKRAGTTVEQNLGPCPWIRNGDPVKAACEDREGNLIVGLLNQGIFWFDAQGHATHISTNDGLANNSVLSLVADADGSLWVGMDGGGPTGRPLNRVIASIFNVLDSCAGRVVQSICADHKGGLWFSPKDNDFCYWKDGATTRVGSTFGSLSRFNPKAILVDADQQVWAATLGINLLRLEGNGFSPVPGAGILNPEISALYQGHDGRLWLGTRGGLGCWNGQEWTNFTTNSGLSDNNITAIADDAKGDVWVGTAHGGLNVLRGGKGAFQKIGGFPGDNVSCLHVDQRGALWIGTFGNGLVRRAGEQFKHYTARNGLVGNSIDYLIEDEEGFLWIGSNAGLVRVNKKELDDYDPGGAGPLFCRGYDQKDGLPATECTYGSQPAACRTGDGVLWFPTIAGMVSVNPSGIKPNTNPPPVVIEEVLADQPSQNTNGLRVAPPTSITVPARGQNLEIHYTSLNLAAADRTLFRFQLEGHQTNWTQAGKDRLARYVNLPHGRYRFHVQARNEDGVWNQAGASLEVIVLPPFWETWWFRAAVVGSLLGMLIATVHFISTQKLQRQLAGLRQQQALEKERARIARDIHDQVGASLTQLSLLGEMIQADKNNPQEAESHARQISQTARETALELDEIVWTVNPSNDTLDGLVNYICKNAQEYLAVAGLRYRLDAPAQLPAAAISPEARHNVFLAAKEAVTNVVRHARASEAWLRLRVAPHSFTLEIEDNGRGLDGGGAAKASETRNGLRNMRKRMEDIGGEFSIGRGEKGGTVVRLTVPLRNL